MTLRDEYETLKSELVVKLTDTTVLCDLTFPYKFTITDEEEDKYLRKGTEARRATKRAMIIIDNAYKKCWLLPSKETAKDFHKMQNDILNDYKKKAIKAYDSESWRFIEADKNDFVSFVDDLISRIKEASKPYVEKLKTMPQEEVERKIEDKDINKIPYNVYELD